MLIHALRHATLRQLQIFEAAAAELSFVGAAERLHLTQPAVSMQMAHLEDNAGVALFERQGKKLFLTPAGEELLSHVRRVIQAMREAGEAMDAIRGLQLGRLTIAAVSTAKYFAPKLLTLFRRAYQKIELRLSVANREEVLRQLRDNAIDLAIMGRPPGDLDTVAEPFAPHPHVIIAPPDHPLCFRRGLTIKDLSGEVFVGREAGSGTRAAMERFFAQHKLAPEIAMVMDSNESIKQAVMAGMGISFISSHTIGLEIKTKHLAVLDIAGLPVVRRWYVVHLASKRLTPVAAAFKQFVFAEAPKYLAATFPVSPVAAPGRRPASTRRKRASRAR